MRGRITMAVASLGALLGSCAFAAVGRADDAPTTMLIVDGSGSMWGRLPPDNRPKIDIVREKLGTVLASPSSTRVGLVSFGHRRRGDCSDVELIAPPDAPRDAVLGPLAKLNPRGPGPITAALKLAVDAIGKARPAQIVVVGDGADNCWQDSCAAAAEFRKTSPGVIVQVIGIGIPSAERPRIACVAQSMGGNYYDIADSNGLNAALDEATKLAMLAPEPIAGANAGSGPTMAPPPPAGATLRASASLASGGVLLNAPVNWRITKKGESASIAENRGLDITAKLDAGDYEIDARLSDISASQEVTIADGVAQSIVVPLAAAHFVARALLAKDTAPSPSAVLTLASGESQVAIGRDGVLDLYLKPADYTVTVADGTASAAQTVSLAAGDAKPLDIVLSAGNLELSSVGVDGKPIEDVLYSIFTDDPESPNGLREVARSRARQASFTLPEGTYYATARSGSGNVRKRVAIGAGATVKDTLVLALVPLKVSVLVAGAPAKPEHNVLYRVDRLDGDKQRVARALSPELTVSLPPGTYRVSASLPAFHMSAAKDIVLEAGKTTSASLEIPAGEVTFEPHGEGSLSSMDAHWEVLDASGTPIWHAVGLDAKALLAPGRYTVRLDSQNTRRQTQFEVRAGENKSVEVGPG